MASEHRRLMGWLHLRGLRCVGRHGAYAGEQEIERVFVADVAVRLDLGAATDQDTLDSTLDFAALGTVVRQVVSGRPRTLLETVAVDAARDVLRRFPAVQEVRVRLGKSHPPGLDAEEEAAEVTLGRD
jgi:dihydroneopterin aldolase